MEIYNSKRKGEYILFKLKITRVEQKNIALDTIKLKNLQEMIQEQDEKLHIGEYYYKIYERKNETILMKVSFHYENIIIKSEKITKKEQKKVC